MRRWFARVNAGASGASGSPTICGLTSPTASKSEYIVFRPPYARTCMDVAGILCHHLTCGSVESDVEDLGAIIARQSLS